MSGNRRRPGTLLLVHLNDEETRRVKEQLIEGYANEIALPGMIVTIVCPEGIVWKDEDNGDEFHGCGKELARFIYADDSDNDTWDIAADLYLSHLHNEHGYGVSINPLDVTD